MSRGKNKAFVLEPNEPICIQCHERAKFHTQRKEHQPMRSSVRRVYVRSSALCFLNTSRYIIFVSWTLSRISCCEHTIKINLASLAVKPWVSCIIYAGTKKRVLTSCNSSMVLISSWWFASSFSVRAFFSSADFSSAAASAEKATKVDKSHGS